MLRKREMDAGNGRAIYIQMVTDIQHIMKPVRNHMYTELVIKSSKEKSPQVYMSVITVIIQGVVIPITYGQEQQKRICRMLKEKVDLAMESVMLYYLKREKKIWGRI
jgi:hypothetical protein